MQSDQDLMKFMQPRQTSPKQSTTPNLTQANANKKVLQPIIISLHFNIGQVISFTRKNSALQENSGRAKRRKTMQIAENAVQGNNFQEHKQEQEAAQQKYQKIDFAAKKQTKTSTLTNHQDDKGIKNQDVQANFILDKFRVTPLNQVPLKILQQGSNSVSMSSYNSPKEQSMISGNFLMERQSLQSKMTHQVQGYHEQRTQVVSNKNKVKKFISGPQEKSDMQIFRNRQNLILQDKNINQSLDRSQNSQTNQKKLRASLLVADSSAQFDFRNQLMSQKEHQSFEDQRSLSNRIAKKNLENDLTKPSQVEPLPQITTKSQTSRKINLTTLANPKEQILNLMKVRKDEIQLRQIDQTEFIDQNTSYEEIQMKQKQTEILQVVDQKNIPENFKLKSPLVQDNLINKAKGLSEYSQEPQLEGEVIYSSLEVSSSESADSTEKLSIVKEHKKNTEYFLQPQKDQLSIKIPISPPIQEEGNIEAACEQLKDVKEIPLISKKPSYLEPLPILPHGKYYDLDNAAWRQKRIKQNVAQKRHRSITTEEDESNREQERRRKVQQYIQKLQEKLQQNADEIIVATDLNINLEKYSQYFLYKIYECFKPKTLKQTRNYIEYLTKDENDISDQGSNISENEVSSELYEYLSKETETRLPGYINQKKLLQFDSNFESGNLDSVYLVNEREYNLMLKVDTNTRGNTYWFYFKVLNWQPGSTITFNILNIGRDLTAFYARGMKIMNRQESQNGQIRSEWVAGQYTVVNEFAQGEIVRSHRKEQKDGKVDVQKYYNKLKFSVKFPEKKTILRKKTVKNLPQEQIGAFGGVLPSQLEQISERNESPGRDSEFRVEDCFFPDKMTPKTEEEEVDGSVFCFAYALPYTYGEMLSDLDTARKHLLIRGRVIKPQTQRKEEAGPEQREQKHTLKNQDSIKLKTPRKRDESSNSIINDSERKKPTKIELAQREIKTKAQNAVKDQLNKFETKLLNDEDYIKRIAQLNQKKQRCVEITTDYLNYKQEVISQSVGGLNVYQLSITKKRSLCNGQTKKCLYIIARQHAAETHGSFIMKYIIEELTQNAEKYDSVLSNYIVRLLPMANPDGVTIGNARSSLVGLDLNRRWSDPNPTIHPEIYFIKAEMAQKANTEQGISIFCDLHGHNKKDNCFFYGCNKAADEGMLSWTKTRLLPKIFAQFEEIFDYKNCRFKQDKYKLNTARVVVWNEMKVTNSFTLETSQFAKSISVPDIYGNELEIKSIQLLTQDLMKISQSFLLAVAQYNQLEKDLEQEFKLHKGWFKPQKLKEITGEAARDKYARQLVQGKEQSATLRKQISKKASNTTNQTYIRDQRVKLSSSKNINNTDEQNIQPKKIQKLQTCQQVNETQQSIILKNTKLFESEKKPDPVENEDFTSEIVKLQFKVFDSNFKVKRNTKTVRKQKTQVISPFEINHSATSDPVVQFVAKWSDLFNEDEFQLGFQHMKKVKPQNLQNIEQEDEESSDSCPSVDNFNAKELQNCFQAVIDKNLANPFARENNESEHDSFESNSETVDPDVQDQQPEQEQGIKELNLLNLSQKESFPNVLSFEEADGQNAHFIQQQNADPNQENSDTSIDSTIIHTFSQPRDFNNVSIQGRQIQPQTTILNRNRPQANRIGYLAAQLQEIERIRLNLADQQQQTNLTSLILQQNATKIHASAGPPSGIKSTNVSRVEQPLVVFNSFARSDYVTPQQVQQNYRGPSIQQLCTQAYQNQVQINQASNLSKQNGQSHSPQIICTGTAKFKFNIFSNMPPIQQQLVPNKKSIQTVKGKSLMLRNAQQSISQPPQQSVQKLKEQTLNSSHKRKSSKQIKRQNINQGCSSHQITNMEKAVKSQERQFFHQKADIILNNHMRDYPSLPQSAISSKHKNQVSMSFQEHHVNIQTQHQAVRNMYTNKYHSPNIKNFEGFDANSPQLELSPPIFQNKKLQELAQLNNSTQKSRKKNVNISSMDAKTAQDISPLLSALTNISVISQQAIKQENQNHFSQHLINRVNFNQQKVLESHYVTQQPNQLVDILHSNIISPRNQLSQPISSPVEPQTTEPAGKITRNTHRRITDKSQIINDVHRLSNQFNQTSEIQANKLMNEQIIQNIYADDYFHDEQNPQIKQEEQPNQLSKTSFQTNQRGRQRIKEISQRIQSTNITATSFNSTHKNSGQKQSRQGSMILQQTHSSFKDQNELEHKNPLLITQMKVNEQMITQLTPQKKIKSKDFQ